MLIAVIGLFATHLIESGLFACGLLLSAEYFEIGGLTGVSGQFREYLYYSMVTYTSLGLGDVFPLGELRLISGIEVLTGLLVMYRHGFLGQPGECIHAAVVSANARRTTAGARKPSRSINHCWL